MTTNKNEQVNVYDVKRNNNIHNLCILANYYYIYLWLDHPWYVFVGMYALVIGSISEFYNSPKKINIDIIELK